MSFPRNRFLEAGASQAELDHAQALYDQSSGPMQDALEDFWAGVATGDLSELVQRWREDMEQTASTGGEEQPEDQAGAGGDEPEPEPEAEPADLSELSDDPDLADLD